MSDNEDVTHQLGSLKHSKASIAEVLKTLDVTQQAFARAARIEEQQQGQQKQIEEIYTTLADLVSVPVFKQRMDELMGHIDKLLHKRFEDLSNKYYDELSQKLSLTDLDEGLKQKVNWANFNTLSQQVTVLKTRIDKHIYSEFQDFKTKMRIELSHKANEAEDLHADLVNNEEIIQIKNRIAQLEQQIKDIANPGDDMLEDDDEDEEHDSEEEMDNMNEDDLVRALMKDKKKNEAEPAGEIPGLHTVKKPEPKPMEEIFQQTSPEADASSQDAQSSKEPQPPKDPQPPKEAQPSKQPKEPSSPAKERSASPAKERAASPSKERAASPSKERSESPTKEGGEGGEGGDDEEGKGESGSRPAMSRVGSRTSSMGKSMVGAVGGNAITQVNKKITQIKKDMEGYRKELDDTKDMINGTEKEIEETNQNLSDLRRQIKEVEDTIGRMEISFIKALRRKGMDKKTKKKKPEATMALPSREMQKITEALEDKARRIVSLESFIDKVINDTNELRSLQREKLNEIIKSLHYLNAARNHQVKEFGSIQSTVKTLETALNQGLTKVQEDFAKLQGPVTNVISDQQRENSILTEDIKRHQGLFRSLVEDYVSTMDVQRPGEPHSPQDTARGESPNLSLKQRFAIGEFSPQIPSPTKVDSHWIGGLPEGQSITLPRVKKPAPSKSVNHQVLELQLPDKLLKRKSLNKSLL